MSDTVRHTVTTRRYVVKWAKVGRRYTKALAFSTRRIAVLKLNSLILDDGEYDARLYVQRETPLAVPPVHVAVEVQQ